MTACAAHPPRSLPHSAPLKAAVTTQTGCRAQAAKPARALLSTPNGVNGERQRPRARGLRKTESFAGSQRTSCFLVRTSRCWAGRGLRHGLWGGAALRDGLWGGADSAHLRSRWLKSFVSKADGDHNFFRFGGGGGGGGGSLRRLREVRSMGDTSRWLCRSCRSSHRRLLPIDPDILPTPSELRWRCRYVCEFVYRVVLAPPRAAARRARKRRCARVAGATPPVLSRMSPER